MKIEVSAELNNAIKDKVEIKRIIYEIKKELELTAEERFPSVISLYTEMTFLPYGRYNPYEDKLEIFIPRLFLSKIYFTKEIWKAVIKYILTHEILEPIERRTVSGGLKAFFNKFYYSLMPVTIDLLDMKYDGLSLEAFSEDTCEDIKTDRRSLYSEEQELGFAAIHTELLEFEKNKLKNLKLIKNDSGYFVNMDPNELMFWLLSGMRKAVLGMQCKKHYFGRFESHILYHIILKAIKYPELQMLLYSIFKEVSKEKPSYKKVYEYSTSFVDNLKYKKELN